MRKPSKKTLKRECDRLLREYIKLRDRGQCQYCGKPGNNSHHIFTKKAYPYLRYNPDNVILLCVYCHRAIAHSKPLEFWEWLRRKKGEKFCDALHTMTYITRSFKTDYYLERLKLQELIEDIIR